MNFLSGPKSRCSLKRRMEQKDILSVSTVPIVNYAMTNCERSDSIKFSGRHALSPSSFRYLATKTHEEIQSANQLSYEIDPAEAKNAR